MTSNDIPMVCVIDDKADLESIRKVLACAHSRAPKIERSNHGPHVSIVQLSWVWLDSPKREASFRISSLEAQRVRHGTAEEMRALAVEILERALSEDPSHKIDEETIHRWHSDLQDVGTYAAIRQHESDPTPSRVDFCHATAGTAWADAMGDRPGIKGDDSVIPTIDAERIHRLLPDMPRIVLVRNASTNRRGRSHVGLGALHGSKPFMEIDAAERARLNARFRHLDT